MSTAPATVPDAASAPPPAPPAPAAPDTADALQLRVVELEAHLASARESLTQSERRREVDRLLVESGATDIEATSALVMERIANAAQPDVADEVRALRRRKPGLFRHATHASSMGGRETEPPSPPAESAAMDAQAGGRAALLRYMRARRS